MKSRLVWTWLVLTCLLCGARAGEPDDAFVEQRKPNGALAWFKSGVELARRGEYRAALSRFERASALSPHWALPHLEIAVAHLMTDNDRKVIGRALAEAVRLGQEIPRAHYLYGVHLQEVGKRAEAIRSLTRALQLRPSLLDARYRLATLYIEEGRQAEGIHQYEQVLKQRPSHLGSHRNLAVLFEQSGQFEEAEEHLKTITRLHPENAFHLANLASFYERVGWHGKAKATRIRAERLDPAHDRRRLRPLLKSRD